MQTLTAAQLAEKIMRPRESLRVASDRIRNWTREGLLSTVGDKNPGTGRSRLYSHDALLEAAILAILTECTGMPVAGAGPTLKVIKEMVEPKWRASGTYQPGPPRVMYATKDGLPGRNNPDRDVLILSRSIGKPSLILANVQLQTLQEYMMQERYDTHTVVDLQLMFDRLLQPLETPFTFPENAREET